MVQEIASRLAAGEQGISGGMVESFIEAGHQSPGRLDELVYGKSITDSCVSWERTNELLHTLSAAIRERRALH